MKRLVMVIGLVIVLALPLSAAGSIHAQGDAGDPCSAESVGATIANAQAILADAQTATDAGELGSALALFGQASELLDGTTGDCAALLAPPLCETYPQYCAPRVGGAPVAGNTLEATSPQPVDEGVVAAGVVRGVTDDGALFVGNPDAPVHIMEFADFACPHCIDYHETTTSLLMEQAIATGRATFQVRPLAFVAGQFSTNAAYAFLCAGEQGAAWEMHDALYRSVRQSGASVAYTVDALGATAAALGLNGTELAACVDSGRYADALATDNDDAERLGVTATPTVLVSLGDSGEWAQVARDFNSLMDIIAQAENGE